MNTIKNGHRIELLKGSEQYFAQLIAAFETAQFEIWQEAYIFDFAGGGQDVAAALIQAAQRGVKVRLMVDGAGTGEIPADWRARFEAAGVELLTFNPMGKLGLLKPSRWRRLHRKLCVVDGAAEQAVGFCGGINILDDYHDPNHGALDEPRFDFAIRIEGVLLSEMRQAMETLWHMEAKISAVRDQMSAQNLMGLLTSWRGAASQNHALQSAFNTTNAIKKEAVSAYSISAKLIFRDNFKHRKTIEKAYLKAIGHAQKEIIIANAYFLPGGKLRKALVHAARRGVRVQLLLQGRYEYFMQYHAARPVYAALLKSGIEIYEYSASFLHAKVAVIDAEYSHTWATVGSSNLDPLSLLLAREANVMVRDVSFASQLSEQLQSAMLQKGQRLEAQKFADRSFWQKTLDAFAYGLMRMALSITGKRY